MQNVSSFLADDTKIYAFYDYDSVDDAFLSKSMKILPIDRKIKASKYRNRIDRINCVIAYLLLLFGLRNQYGIDKFSLSYRENGKPYITEYPYIHFNISHCPCGCVCVISDKPIGIDIQDIHDISEDVIKNVCSEKEIGHILSEADNKNKAFAEIWAMKESYFKKSGDGLIGDLKAIDTFSDYSRLIVSNDKCVIALSI